MTLCACEPKQGTELYRQLKAAQTKARNFTVGSFVWGGFKWIMRGAAFVCVGLVAAAVFVAAGTTAPVWAPIAAATGATVAGVIAYRASVRESRQLRVSAAEPVRHQILFVKLGSLCNVPHTQSHTHSQHSHLKTMLCLYTQEREQLAVSLEAIEAPLFIDDGADAGANADADGGQDAGADNEDNVESPLLGAVAQ
jgi:hypothetical protein